MRKLIAIIKCFSITALTVLTLYILTTPGATITNTMPDLTSFFSPIITIGIKALSTFALMLTMISLTTLIIASPLAVHLNNEITIRKLNVEEPTISEIIPIIITFICFVLILIESRGIVSYIFSTTKLNPLDQNYIKNICLTGFGINMLVAYLSHSLNKLKENQATKLN